MASTERYKWIVIFALASLAIFAGCSTSRSINELPTGRVVRERDQIRNITRVRLNLEHTNAEERLSPFINTKQSFLKEYQNEGEETITVFEVFRMQPNSFPVENTIYIAAGNTSIAILTTRIDFTEVARLITTDSNTGGTSPQAVQPITNFENYVATRFTYNLSPQVVELIQRSNRISFRYYSGADMVTIRLSFADIRNLRRFLNTR